MNKAKKIYLSLIFLSVFHSAVFADNNLAIKIIRVAQSQLGNGELTANNSGKYVRLYTKREEPLPWCAGFVSYVLEKASAGVSYTLRAKTFLTYGDKVAVPEPGDIAVYTRKGGGHVGIVEQVFKDYYITIDGNVGSFPAVVQRVKHSYNQHNFMSFIRIK